MADITIDAAIANANARGNRSLVFVSQLVGYSFMMNGTIVGYYKTVDGGATWAAAVTVKSVTTGIAFDVWYDQWTPGDAGRMIHIWYLDTTNDRIFYRSLNTTNDTLGTEITVFTGLTAIADYGVHVSGAKMRGGNLLCAFDIDAGTETGTYKSVDNGANWSSVSNAIEAVTDRCLVFPGNVADPNDAWILYQDASASELTLKEYDDSANTYSESATMQTFVPNVNDITGQGGFSGSIRKSDGHLIAAYMDVFDVAGASDFKVYDIASTTSLTALTDIATNVDDIYYPSVYINDRSNHIYISYIGKSDGSETIGTTTFTYYAKSTDNGLTWTKDNLYSEGSGLWRNTWTPLSGPRFHVNWRSDVASDDLLTNFNKSLDLGSVSLNNYQFIKVVSAGVLSVTERIR